jgi:hypothetical protein
MPSRILVAVAAAVLVSGCSYLFPEPTAPAELRGVSRHVRVITKVPLTTGLDRVTRFEDDRGRELAHYAIDGTKARKRDGEVSCVMDVGYRRWTTVQELRFGVETWPVKRRFTVAGRMTEREECACTGEHRGSTATWEYAIAGQATGSVVNIDGARNAYRLSIDGAVYDIELQGEYRIRVNDVLVAGAAPNQMAAGMGEWVYEMWIRNDLPLADAGLFTAFAVGEVLAVALQ